MAFSPTVAVSRAGKTVTRRSPIGFVSPAPAPPGAAASPPAICIGREPSMVTWPMPRAPIIPIMLSAAWSLLSESTRKLALVTTRSPAAAVGEHHLAPARVEHGRPGDDQALAERDTQLDGAVHLRAQELVGRVRKLEADLRRARLCIQHRRDVGDARREALLGVGGERERGLLADLHERQLVLVDVAVDPDGREIGELVERHAGLHPLAGDRHLLDDDARDGRVDGERAPRLPALLELAHLLRREVPETEPLAAGARERSRGHPRLGERALPEPPLRLAREEVLALRGQELRAVEGEERIALADGLPGVVRVKLLDEAAHLERHLSEPALVEVEPADGADHLLDRAALGRAPGEADRLLLGGVETDRGARELGRLVDGEGGARQGGEDDERERAGHGRSSRGSSPPTAVSRPA